MEAKHTKGPWSATKGSSAGYDIICSEVLPVDVCVISKRDKSPEEISANISLILASPDLRDALEDCQWGATIGGQAACPQCGSLRVDGHKPKCLIGAALAKAKGE